MTRVAVTLLSGGIDSTVALAITHKENPDTQLFGVVVNYGQRHNREIAAAQDVANALPWPIVRTTMYMEGYARLAWASGLTRLPHEIEVDGPTPERHGIPASYVPLRNTMMLTLAAAYLESHVLEMIERDGVQPTDIEALIVIGANADDYRGYPDCRPAYYRTLAQTFYYGSKIGMQYGVAINISTPLIYLHKPDIIRRGTELGAPLHLTRSCYRNEVLPCGICDACRLRAQAFAEVGIPDPSSVGRQGNKTT